MAHLLTWIKGARWRESLSHCVEGLIPLAVLTLVTWSAWFGAAGVVIWYWSRKKLEVEIAGEQPGQTHVDTWLAGWFPWQWSLYQVLDVVFPTLSSFAIAAVLNHFHVLPTLADLIVQAKGFITNL
ncbi:hypothetical protein ACODYM_28785 [Burkholderia gladioli]|uniref:hypothetical protein n=1 Tax=Burkholderia gladioli TaxID=28095 RepID=UPI003B504E40